MKETPPYSLAEIRGILSQYLDGALDAERMLEIDTLLEQFPQYQEAFLKLQATRGLVRDALERQAETPLHYTKISDGVWKNIAATLKADQQQNSAVYDAEFISAYYDGEIPAESDDLHSFESQLYGNKDANRLLAELGEVSEAVRQFGYRLENGCSLDLAAQVMAIYREEQGLTPANLAEDNAIVDLEALIPAEVELMSAYADQELSPRETIEANRLIESSDSARATLAGFTSLSAQIHQMTNALQAQAPDLWPAVEAVLTRAPEEGGLAIPIRRGQKLQKLARIALPAAAAAVLLMFFMPHGVGPVSQQGTASNTLAAYHSQTRDERQAAPKAPAELASVPGTTFGPSLAPEQMALPAAPMRSPATADMGVNDMPAPVSQPLKPILEPSPQLAATPSRRTTDTASDMSGGKVPSSEEYLFNALNEQMPDDDVSAILGK